MTNGSQLRLVLTVQSEKSFSELGTFGEIATFGGNSVYITALLCKRFSDYSFTLNKICCRQTFQSPVLDHVWTIFAPCHHWPNMSKTHPLDLVKGSRLFQKALRTPLSLILYLEMSYSFPSAGWKSRYHTTVHVNLRFQIFPDFPWRWSKYGSKIKIRCRRACKKAEKLKILISRGRYVQIPWKISFHIDCKNQPYGRNQAKDKTEI